MINQRGKRLYNCLICDSEDIYSKVLLYREQKWTLSVCNDCEHEFLNPLPGKEQEIQLRYEKKTYKKCDYDIKNSSMFDPLSEADYVYNLGVIEQIRGRPLRGRFLDFGCGFGFACYIATLRGYDAIGFDPCVSAVDIGRQKFKLDLKSGKWCDVKPEIGEVDLIYIHHVFEHIAYPNVQFKDLFELLRPGGGVVVAVPNRKTIINQKSRYGPPGHIQYFGSKSLKLLMERNGIVSLQFREGIPFIRRYFKLFGKCPPQRFIDTVHRITAHLGFYGGSLTGFGKKL